MNGLLSKLGFSKEAVRPAPPSSWRDENEPRIVYHVRPRARRISLKMDAARREIVVAVPGSAKKLESARRFAREKYDWIQVQLETLPPAQPFCHNGQILFRGELYQLLSTSTRGHPSYDENTRTINVPAPEGTLEGRTKRFLIRQARETLTARTHVHAQMLGKPVSKVSVRDTSSRWGSCVTRRGEGQISYSWRLICAPPFVLDYVAAHECAHLVEANHGANFWNLCDELVETVKPAKRWLNQNGALLHAVGAHH